MRYKTLIQQKFDLVDGTVSNLDIALSRNDKGSIERFIEELKLRLEEIKEVISVEPDDFEIQFQPQNR